MEAINNKPTNILKHSLFWVVYFSLWAVIFNGKHEFNIALSRAILLVGLQAALVYLNTEFLIPKYYIQKRYLEYFLYTAFCLVVLFFCFMIIYKFLLPMKFPPFDGRPGFELGPGRFDPGIGRGRFGFGRPTHALMSAIADTATSIFIFTIALAYKTGQIAIIKAKEAAQLKSEKLNTELKFLKSQINPHFLFNALHNIYTLSVIKSEQTPEMILKLSDMLRYMLYDCKEDKVPLKREIDYLKNFIHLVKLKDDQIINIKTDFKIEDGSIMIEPMLFIPFVENSFKHCKIEDVVNGWVDLRIIVEDRQLECYIENSISPETYTKDVVGGIGLENARRRLELLYPDRHELTIEQSEKQFSVHLTLLL